MFLVACDSRLPHDFLKSKNPQTYRPDSGLCNEWIRLFPPPKKKSMLPFFTLILLQDEAFFLPRSINPLLEPHTQFFHPRSLISPVFLLEPSGAAIPLHPIRFHVPW